MFFCGGAGSHRAALCAIRPKEGGGGEQYARCWSGGRPILAHLYRRAFGCYPPHWPRFDRRLPSVESAGQPCALSFALFPASRPLDLSRTRFRRHLPSRFDGHLAYVTLHRSSKPHAALHTPPLFFFFVPALPYCRSHFLYAAAVCCYRSVFCCFVRCCSCSLCNRVTHSAYLLSFSPSLTLHPSFLTSLLRVPASTPYLYTHTLPRSQGRKRVEPKKRRCQQFVPLLSSVPTRHFRQKISALRPFLLPLDHILSTAHSRRSHCKTQERAPRRTFCRSSQKDLLPTSNVNFCDRV